MKCEHAQEFFSEYIERSLDKPTGVAMEAHLTACAACNREVEGLRQMWAAMEAMPAVEPPKDLAWRVMTQLQQERAERLEAERARRNPFTAWLQSLTPGAAFGYATLTALLLVAVAFPLSGPLRNGVGFGWDRVVQQAPAPPPVDGMREPLINLPRARQEAPNSPWYYPLVITVPASLGESQVTVTPMVIVNGQLTATTPRRLAFAPGQTRMIPVDVALGAQTVQAVQVRVDGSGGSFQKVVGVPEFGGRGGM